MNDPHFQSGLIASTVFTEFPVTLLVNVILSPSSFAQRLRLASSVARRQESRENLKIVF